MVDGGFDPLHHGHVAYFYEASTLGLPVLCNMAADSHVDTKHTPLLKDTHRAHVLDAMGNIHYTHINHSTTANILRELQPRYYVKGKDWEGRLPQEEMDVCEQYGIEIVFLDTVRDSSSALLDRFVANSSQNGSSTVRQFEEMVFGQKEWSAGDYDDDYFEEEWREQGHSYQLEARREIEGRNPALIKEVFQPKRALDMGCGPGSLMYLLYELGVDTDGIDFSPSSKTLAPHEVRDKIVIGSVTEPVVPDNSYDLVICRETLEHLTILQVREAVRCICNASSRYIYITTRFHPERAGFLDVTDQPDVDPTHITLLKKDFLRVLFVLEGFRSRPDLEARMDWLNKGRVLVLEKST